MLSFLFFSLLHSYGRKNVGHWKFEDYKYGSGNIPSPLFIIVRKR